MLVRMQVLGHVTAVSTLLRTVGLPESEPCMLGARLIITDGPCDSESGYNKVVFCQSIVSHLGVFSLGKTLTGKTSNSLVLFSQMLMTNLFYFNI